MEIKEATIQEPTNPTPTPAFDLNALLMSALAPVVQHMTAPLLARIEVLERSLVVADKAAQGNESDLFVKAEDLSSRVALLEDKLDNITTASDERIKEIADEVARDVMSEHVGDYDHDEYDRLEDKIEEKVSDAIDDYDFEDKINDALRSATITISV